MHFILSEQFDSLLQKFKINYSEPLFSWALEAYYSIVFKHLRKHIFFTLSKVQSYFGCPSLNYHNCHHSNENNWILFRAVTVIWFLFLTFAFKSMKIIWHFFVILLLQLTTLDSGIDIAPGINVAPLLKIFTSRF